MSAVWEKTAGVCGRSSAKQHYAEFMFGGPGSSGRKGPFGVLHLTLYDRQFPSSLPNATHLRPSLHFLHITVWSFLFLLLNQSSESKSPPKYILTSEQREPHVGGHVSSFPFLPDISGKLCVIHQTAGISPWRSRFTHCNRRGQWEVPGHLWRLLLLSSGKCWKTPKPPAFPEADAIPGNHSGQTANNEACLNLSVLLRVKEVAAIKSQQQLCITEQTGSSGAASGGAEGQFDWTISCLLLNPLIKSSPSCLTDL